MRKRWTVKEDWLGPLIFMYVLGWVPVCIVAQTITARHGMDGSVTWAFWVALGAWFAPAILAALGLFAHWAITTGMPFHRVTEPVTTDLREVHRS